MTELLNRLVVVSMLALCSCDRSSTESSTTVPLPEAEQAAIVLDQDCGGYARFKLPSRFQETPESHAGENKWSAEYIDTVNEISVSMGSFGRITDLELIETVPRFRDMSYREYRDAIDDEGISREEVIAKEAEAKTYREYFLQRIVPEGREFSDFPHFERYVYEGDGKIEAFFFNKEPGQMHCYEGMTILFPKEKLEENKALFNAIIASVKPWLSRQKRFSEQEEADRHPTAK